MTNIEQTIFNMLTENTGSHMLDSGGAYGRHHQRNANKTIDDFKNAPQCTLVIHMSDDKKSVDWLELDIDLFHHLTSGILELDHLCDEFNAMECDVFNGEYYGTNADQSEWLENHNLVPYEHAKDRHGETSFNSYNWNANFSQTIQGTFLEDDYRDCYVLLQIHGGCDVRGGYTDAKLFKVNTAFQEHYALIDERATFWTDNYTIDWYGTEFVNVEGQCVTDDDEIFIKMALENGLDDQNRATLKGGLMQ